MENEKQNAFQKYIINNPRGIFDVIKKKDFWKKLADERNAEFKIITTVSRDLNKIQIKYPYKNNQIIITETDTKPLFIETNLILRHEKEVYFQITENEFVERLLSKFSNKTIKLNNVEFDKKYLIKSNRKELVEKLLENSQTTESLLILDIFYIEGSSNIDKNIFNLKFNVNRNVNSYEYLKSLLLVFCVFIDRLEEIKIIKTGTNSKS
jgi:hypothetical protein